MKPVSTIQTIAQACEMQVNAQRVILADARGAVPQVVVKAAREYSRNWSEMMASQRAANDEPMPSA